MSKVSSWLAKTLSLSLELLKAIDERDHAQAYELKQKIKIYKKDESGSKEDPDRIYHRQKMKEYILEGLIQREKSWIDNFWETLGNQT